MSEIKKVLDKGKLETIKKRLLDRKKQLESQLAELYKDKPAIEQSGMDVADHVQSLSIETLNASLQNAELEEFKRIRRALEMIDEGTYGICVDCGEPISEKRLLMYPDASRCLMCQEVYEEQRNEQ